MANSCTVLIGPSDLLPTLRERPAMGNNEVLTFTDAETLLALEAMHKRRPSVVALERLFAATSRGAALINRIKADPHLTNAEIRVVSRDSNYMRVSPRAVAAPAQALDQRGTRRAPRVRIAPGTPIVVDGKRATFVDLSTVGAQVVSPGTLKPKQTVSILFKDGDGTVDCSGVVAWASFEMSPDGGARYRAGIDLTGADPASVDAFIQRHKAS